MALLFYDSFDHYTTILRRYDVVAGGPSISSSAGRNGTAGLFFGNGGTVVKNIGPANPFFVGGSYKRETLSGTGEVFSFSENGGAHVIVRSTPNGGLEVRRGGAGIGTFLHSTAAGLISADVDYFIEVEVFVHDTNGYVNIWIHDIQVMDTMTDVGALDTRNGGTLGTVDGLQMQGIAGVAVSYDDVYVVDTTGSAPLNDRLGDCRSQALAVTGAGSSAQWTPLSGNNYENVDDAGDADEDTTYNSSSTPGDIDLHAIANLVNAPDTVYAVQVLNRFRKDDAGTRTVAAKVRSGGVTDTGASQSVSTSYATTATIFPTKPGGGSWAPGDFPIEAGIELIS